MCTIQHEVGYFTSFDFGFGIHPLTFNEIATAQKADWALQQNKDKYKKMLVENMNLLCKDGKLVMPKSLQHRAVSWYHNYLQHSGNTCLEETLMSKTVDPVKFIEDNQNSMGNSLLKLSELPHGKL